MNRKLMQSLCLILLLALYTGCVRQTPPETTGPTTGTEATTEEGTFQGDTPPQSYPVPRENRRGANVLLAGVASPQADGYYSAARALKFYDAQSGKTVFLCSQLGCTHSDSTCRAWLGQVDSLLAYGDKVFASVTDEQGTSVICKDIAAGENTVLDSWEQEEGRMYSSFVYLCSHQQLLVVLSISFSYWENGAIYQETVRENWLYDLETGEKRKLDWTSGDERMIIYALNREYAVVEYYRPRKYDSQDEKNWMFGKEFELRLYRLSDDSYTVISTEKENGYIPAIDPSVTYGSVVLFREKDTLCLYDLDKLEKRELLTAENISNYWILDNKVFYIQGDSPQGTPGRTISIYYADIETGQPVQLENGGNTEVMDFGTRWEGDSFFVGLWKGGNYIIPKADFYLDNYEAARPGGF